MATVSWLLAVQRNCPLDVTGIEPVTPCLQIQKTKLDDIKKDGKE